MLKPTKYFACNIFILLFAPCYFEHVAHQYLKTPVGQSNLHHTKQFPQNSSNLWESYYQCQQEQYDKMNARKSSVERTAIAAFEGSLVRYTVCF
jgi:hypothetical protein